MKKKLSLLIVLLFSLFTSAWAGLHNIAGDKVIYSWPSDGTAANKVTLAEGVTVEINGNTDKTVSNGSAITVGETQYTSMKVSNGAQNTLTLSKNAVAVTFYSYINKDSSTKDSYWKEVNGVNYDATTSGGAMASFKKGANPDVRRYEFETPTKTITFNNAGEQLCYIVEVEYEDGDTPTPDEPSYYVVGSMTNWETSEDYLLVKNAGAEGEYMFTGDFKANDEIKVKSSEGNWYPDTQGGNYVFQNDGNFTIYFRPAGNQDWPNIYFYVAENVPVVKDPSTSLNIEQLVLDEGTSADIATILTRHNIEFKDINALDSLNDDKTDRNEPFLGLKVKTQGAYINVVLEKGKTLKVKFGCVNDPVTVSINGTPINEQIAANKAGGDVFTLDAADADREVTFTTTTAKTVVFKQIMIGEDIAEVTLPAPLKTFTATFTTDYEWEKVYAYAWTGDGEQAVKFLGDWPGTELQKAETGAYTCTIEAAEAPANIIFNNGSSGEGNQTDDLAFEDGKAYSFNKPVPTKYTVSIAEDIQNGTVNVVPTEYEAGQEVTVVATPAENYELEAITAVGKTTNEAIRVTDGKFTMIADDVIVSATFKEIPQLIGYYVVGTMNEWSYDDAYKMQESPTAQGIYEYTAKFAVGDEFKVMSMMSDKSVTWYPDNMANYAITQAGEYTITFNPEGNVQDWYGGFFNVAMKEEPIVVNDYTVQFVNGAGWENVYAYTWTGTGETKVEQLDVWPGKPMGLIDTEAEIDGKKYPVYELKFKAAVEPANIIFSDGTGGEAGVTQTEDLVFENNKQYQLIVKDEPQPEEKTLTIDFEKAATEYTDWTFTNITTKQTNSEVQAHAGDYFGTTGGKASGSIVTKEKIAKPLAIQFYISKLSTNTNANSNWLIEVSSDGTTWETVKTRAAASDITKGTWTEVSQDLSKYEDVYVRVSYDGTTANRTIDDLTLTYTDEGGGGGGADDPVYIAAGDKAVWGSSWDAKDTNNQLTKDNDGKFSITKEDLNLAAGEYGYKIVKDGTWIPDGTDNDKKLSIAENGQYKVVLTVDPEAEADYLATATKTGEYVEPEPVYVAVGAKELWGVDAWTIAEENTLIKDNEGKYSITKENLLLPEGQYGYKIVKDGTWIPDGTDNEKKLEITETAYYNVTLTVDPADVENYLATAVKAASINTIAEVQAAERDAEVTVQGIIYASAAKGAVLYDGDDYLYYYNTKNALNIGQKVLMAGKVGKYGGASQLTADATITDLGTVDGVVYPDPVELKAADFDAIAQENTETVKRQYVTYTGKLTISGNYYNIAIEGTTANIMASLVAPKEDISELNGKDIVVKGYMMYKTSNNQGQFAYTVATSVEEYVAKQQYSVSFTTDKEWKEVHAYTWSGDNVTAAKVEQLGQWPGKEMEVSDAGYVVTIEAAEAPDFIIFNDGTEEGSVVGTNQTADLPFVDGMIYSLTTEKTTAWAGDPEEAIPATTGIEISATTCKDAGVQAEKIIRIVAKEIAVAAPARGLDNTVTGDPNDIPFTVTKKDGTLLVEDKDITVTDDPGSGGKAYEFTVSPDASTEVTTNGFIIKPKDEKNIAVTAIEVEKAKAPAPVDYYVVGTMTDPTWTRTDAYKLATNPEVEGEYMLETAFAANDKIKVQASDETWYPAGTDNDWVITEAGDYTVYFRPAGNTEWANGYFTVIKKEVPKSFATKVAEALAAGTGEVTVTMEQDETLDAAINVPLGKQLVLDGANKTLTLGAETNFVLNDNITLKNVKIDATELTKPLIALTADPAEGTKKNQDVYTDASAQDFNLLNAVTVEGAMVKNLKTQFISSNGADWALENFTLTKSIIQLDATGKNFIAFDATANNKGAIKNITISENTIYNINETSNAYFIRFANSSNAAKAFGTNNGTSTFDYKLTKNTIINTFKAQNFGNNTPNNAKTTIEATQNIYVDLKQPSKFIQGNCTKTVEKNVSWGGTEEATMSEHIDPAFTVPTTALDLTAENGGIDLKIDALSKAAEYQSGDPRWLVPAMSYYLVGNMTEWKPNAEYKLTANTAAEGVEYMITVDLAADAQFKIAKSDGTTIADTDWYPTGMGNNYGENGELQGAGKYTVYFRPNADGGDDWFYHVIFAQKFYNITVVNCDGMTITPEVTEATAGTKVWATVAMTEGYEPEFPGFTNTDTGDVIEMTEGTDVGMDEETGKVWIIMPAQNLTITAKAAKVSLITLDLSQENGSATCISVNKEDPASFYKKEGKEIYLNVTPDAGYTADITVTAGEDPVEVIAEAGTYHEQAYTHKFIMPGKDVTVKVTFTKSTAINGIDAEDADDNAPIYNLAGQKVDKNYKGVVIKNGKKVYQK